MERTGRAYACFDLNGVVSILTRENIFEGEKKRARRQDYWEHIRDMSRAGTLYVLELMGSVG